MDLKLLEIAGKQAGTYFIVTDNSAVPSSITTSKLRLVPISSTKGPVNTVVIFDAGDTTSFETVFGKSTRQMERRGNQSLKTALKCLEAGPVAVINLRKFDNTLDFAGYQAMSANATKGETGETPFTSLFNTNSLWTVMPKYLGSKITKENHLLNFANVGASDISIFVVVSTHVESVTSEGNETLSSTELEIEEYPALNPEMLLKDTFVDVYVFNNTFDPKTVGTNKYYGNFFDVDGNIDYSRLEELSSVTEAGFYRRFTGSLIPNLVSENGAGISIDTVINQAYQESGLIAFLNDEVLESENLETIDLDGSSFYDNDGVLIAGASSTLFSHVVPENVSRTFVPYPPKAEEIKVYEDQEVIFETERVKDDSGNDVPNEFIGVFEQGIRVGDKIKGLNGAIVEVTGLEVLETDVPPYVEPVKEKYTLTLEDVENGSVELLVDGKPVESGVELEEGTLVTVKTEPAENFKLGGIYVNGEALPEGVTSFNISANTVLTVAFAPIEYKVTVNVVGEGSVSVTDADGETVTSGDYVKKGAELTIVPTPETGYQIKAVKVNSIVLTEPYKGIVSADTVIEVEFEPVKYKVNVTNAENGSIVLENADGEVIAAGSDVAFNSIVVVRATPNEHYDLDKIFVNGAALDSGISQFVVNGVMTVTATFVAKKYTVTFPSTIFGGNIVLKANGIAVASGEKLDAKTVVSIEATPDAHWELSEITVNNEVIEGIEFTLIEDSTVNVTFSPITHVITKMAAENGSYSVKYEDGNAVVSGTSVNEGTELFIEATPDAHYEVDTITVNGTPLVDGSFIVESASTIEVTFKRITHKVTVSKVGDAATSANVKVTDINGNDMENLDAVGEGLTLKVVATPVTGVVISGVQANSEDITTTMYFEVTANTTVTVTCDFKEYPVRITSDAGVDSAKLVANGRDIVNGATIAYNVAGVEVQAILNTGYKLKTISVNGSEMVETTDSFTVADYINQSSTEIEVVVTTEKLKFPVTINKTGNGTFTVMSDGTAIASDDEVEYGSVLSFVSEPDANHHLETFEVNGATSEVSDPVTVTSAVSVNVEFAIDEYTVTFNEPEHGTVLVTKTTTDGSVQVNSGDKVVHGTELTVTATPNEGYTATVTPGTSITVTENVSIEVTFSETSVEGGGTIEEWKPGNEGEIPEFGAM